MEDLVVVKIFNTRIEAEIAKGLLEANKIDSIIQADDEGGMAPFPFKPTSMGIRLLIKQSDLQKAEKLLKARKL